MSNSYSSVLDRQSALQPDAVVQPIADDFFECEANLPFHLLRERASVRAPQNPEKVRNLLRLHSRVHSQANPEEGEGHLRVWKTPQPIQEGSRLL